MYFLFLNGQSVGPMTKEQVAAYPVTQDTPVSVDGAPWRPLYSFPELMEATAGARRASDDSKRIVCGVLAIVLGGLGLHYFVIGKALAGLITIVLTLVTCGLWSVVTLIQGVMILCMSDEEWKRKYVDSPSAFPLF